MCRFTYPIVFLVVTIVGLMPRKSQADLILDFSPDGSATSFSVLAGGTVEVPVYLRQLSVSPPTPDITTDGLIDFGLSVTLSGGSIAFTAATTDSAFDFGNLSTVNSPTSASLVGSVQFTTPGITGSAIKLGSLTIVGNTAGSTSTLTLFDTNPGMSVQDFLTENLSGNFDSDVFAPAATTTLSVVPEPSGLLAGLLGIAFCAVCRTTSQRRAG